MELWKLQEIIKFQTFKPPSLSSLTELIIIQLCTTLSPIQIELIKNLKKKTQHITFCLNSAKKINTPVKIPQIFLVLQILPEGQLSFFLQLLKITKPGFLSTRAINLLLEIQVQNIIQELDLLIRKSGTKDVCSTIQTIIKNT